MEQAKTLRQAIPNLDHTKPLEMVDLANFYVQREEVREQLADMQLLLEEQYPCKFLLTGHRGVGKSSALASLDQTLSVGGQMWVVHISVLDELDLNDLDYSDIVLLMALEILQSCLDKNLDLGPELRGRLEKWGRETEIIQQETSTAQAELEAKVEVASSPFWLRALIAVKGRLGKEDVTRRTIRENIKPKFSGLLAIIDDLQQTIFKDTGKRLVCLIDGPDKASVETAENLFYRNGYSLSAPNCSIVYTFPVALQHSDEFNQVRAYFTQDFPVPNFKVQVRDPNQPAEVKARQEGLEQLKQVIAKRVDPDLFEAGVLDELVAYSGGIPRTLIQLTQLACLRANTARSDKVTLGHVQQAIAKEQRGFQRNLSHKQLALLRKVRDTHLIDTDLESGYLELLHNLSAVEYVNGKVWYDVHPLVRDLL
jgi:hypothetical protein